MNQAQQDAAVITALVRAVPDRHAHDAAVLGTHLQLCDAGREFVSTRNNYVWVWAAGRHFRPRRLAEIGTRFGYSLKAIADGSGHPPSELVIRCWDAELDDDVEPLRVAEAYFTLMMIDFRAYRLNTRYADQLHPDGGPFDLVSVDGDHSTDGALADMKLLTELLKPGGAMIVDDTNPGSVLEAVERFVADTGWEWAHLRTLRGMTILRKPNLGEACP